MEKWEEENNKTNLKNKNKNKSMGERDRHIDQDLKKELHFICRAAALIRDERSTSSKIINRVPFYQTIQSYLFSWNEM